jgi:hypothetical protein
MNSQSHRSRIVAARLSVDPLIRSFERNMGCRLSDGLLRSRPSPPRLAWCCGLSNTVAAPQSIDGQSVSQPIVSGHRQITAVETGRAAPELTTARSEQPVTH